MKKHRWFPTDPTVRVIRGRRGLAPVGDLRDPVMRDLSPLGNLWPQVCRPCPCEACRIKRELRG